jgi:hypothetical protein
LQQIQIELLVAACDEDFALGLEIGPGTAQRGFSEVDLGESQRGTAGAKLERGHVWMGQETGIWTRPAKPRRAGKWNGILTRA